MAGGKTRLKPLTGVDGDDDWAGETRSASAGDGSASIRAASGSPTGSSRWMSEDGPPPGVTDAAAGMTGAAETGAAAGAGAGAGSGVPLGWPFQRGFRERVCLDGGMSAD